ncbi:ComEA family DNA-binding protein [Rhodonellum sp.]|uniref:ComEA family DNA-binding protein n=1 Tax=Rhodonellum sp. TaxID=2231180 RepID=UPI002722EA7B|nr:helix-hairpin-helix domain-containing protein [Rhodonellum sp.]MDO9551831.1 helix-hairpin-helix domain-containing protein [Rhodonellum sp.]
MLSKINFFLKNYLGFTRRESRGFVFVLPVLFVLYGVPVVYDSIIEKQNAQYYKEYLLALDSLDLEGAGWLQFHSMKDSILKSGTQDSVKKVFTYKSPKSPVLNKLSFSDADSVVLQIVPGIGQTMAGRIVKFRENLGGLHQKEQLLEVYGMMPEVMDRVYEYFEFSPGISKKIKINELDVTELAKHPYINYGTAKVIIAFREQHGRYSSAEDLLKIKIFNEEWLQRLRPYLEF